MRISKSNIVLNRVLETVSAETDIPTGEISSQCSKTEVVDARWVCVKLLSEYGYYPSKIAGLMHITPRYVQYILTDFYDRITLNRLMRINYEKARNILRNGSETTD